MSAPPRAYLEHAALRVRDIGWHIRFFEALFGWTIRQVDGDAASPRQVWIGGLQLIAAPAFDGADLAIWSGRRGPSIRMGAGGLWRALHWP